MNPISLKHQTIRDIIFNEINLNTVFAKKLHEVLVYPIVEKAFNDELFAVQHGYERYHDANPEDNLVTEFGILYIYNQLTDISLKYNSEIDGYRYTASNNPIKTTIFNKISTQSFVENLIFETIKDDVIFKNYLSKIVIKYVITNALNCKALVNQKQYNENCVYFDDLLNILDELSTKYIVGDNFNPGYIMVDSKGLLSVSKHLPCYTLLPKSKYKLSKICRT